MAKPRANIVDLIYEFVMDGDLDFVSYIIEEFNVTSEEIAGVIRKLYPEKTDAERAEMLDAVFADLRVLH